MLNNEENKKLKKENKELGIENKKLGIENRKLKENNKFLDFELNRHKTIVIDLDERINKNEVLLTNSIKNILIEALRIKELYDLKILIEEHKDLKGNDGARRSFIAINKEIIKGA